jgi:hypothetical protein
MLHDIFNKGLEMMAGHDLEKFVIELARLGMRATDKNRACSSLSNRKNLAIFLICRCVVGAGSGSVRLGLGLNSGRPGFDDVFIPPSGNETIGAAVVKVARI